MFVTGAPSGIGIYWRRRCDYCAHGGEISRLLRSQVPALIQGMMCIPAEPASLLKGGSLELIGLQLNLASLLR